MSDEVKPVSIPLPGFIVMKASMGTEQMESRCIVSIPLPGFIVMKDRSPKDRVQGDLVAGFGGRVWKPPFQELAPE